MSRTIVVTGGSSGIGKAIAARFTTAGDSVVITGRRPDTVERAAAELGARGMQCDAASVTDGEAFVERSGEPVDVLINMAGGNTDLTAPGRMTRCRVSHRHGGRIWNRTC